MPNFDFKSYERNTSGVDGMLHDSEMRELYELSKTCSNGCIVEIGNYRGKSTLALAYGSKSGPNCEIYTIDPHREYKCFGPQDRKEFFNNLLKFGVTDIVKPIELKSDVPAEGWKKPIGLLWIDGDHSYEGCKKDVNNWVPHVVKGGIIAFHDADKDHTGVPDAISELLNRNGFQKLRQVQGMAVIQKNI